VDSHDQERITCHDFDDAAHNSLGKHGPKHCLSVTGIKELLKFYIYIYMFHFKFKKSLFLSRGKGEGLLRDYRPPVNSSEFLV